MSVSNPTDSRTEDGLVTLGAGQIHLQRGGTGEPLLYLHGGGGGEWGVFHSLLAEHYDVVAPEHPAFGRSDEIEEVEGVDDLVYHYLDLMDDLGLGQVHLVGISLGGWLAAELAAHSPYRFRSLVLVAPAGLRIPEHPITDLFLMGPEERLRALFRDPSALPAPDPSDWESAWVAYKNMAALARYAWMPFMSDPKLERRLHRVTAPTRVIAFGEDGVIPLAHCERYAARIPGAELRVLPGLAHASDVEDPALLVESVVEFLGD